MADFDFAAWVGRAHAFTNGLRRVPGVTIRSTAVAAPAAEADLQAIERSLGRAIPKSLRTLFIHGAAALDCSYVLEPESSALERLDTVLPDQSRIFGGARLGPASELADDTNAVREWSTDTWIAEEPAQRAMWEGAIPFLRLDDGDYLALDLRADASEPAVAYLCHDDDSFLLAPGLPEFLIAWERLCYVGPEHWLLSPFIGAAGYLDAESARAARLRELFAEPSSS